MFRSIPEGLNGRQLPEIYAGLEIKAKNGDANASLSLGKLVGECKQRLYMIEHSRGYRAPTPEVQKIIDNELAVARAQCPQLSAEQLSSGPSWLLRAAELGDREALGLLPFAPPDVTRDTDGAERAHWRSVIIDGLDKSAVGGDYEAALSLGKFFLADPNNRDEASAGRYFELAERLARTSDLADIARKWKQAVSAKRN